MGREWILERRLVMWWHWRWVIVTIGILHVLFCLFANVCNKKLCFFNHAPVKKRKSPGLSHYLSCPNTSVLASSSSCLSSHKKAKILDMCSGFHHSSWEILLLKASSLIPIALISPHGLLLIFFTHSSFPNFTKAFTWQSRPLATLHENKHVYTSLPVN